MEGCNEAGWQEGQALGQGFRFLLFAQRSLGLNWAALGEPRFGAPYLLLGSSRMAGLEATFCGIEDNHPLDAQIVRLLRGLG